MRLIAVVLLALPLLGPPVAAEAAGPAVGSGNTAPLEPAVAHPNETPCVVTLFQGATFGASDVDYSYTPGACPGPWAKVVFGLDTSVQAGIQYDRTTTVWLAGVNVLFGTTSEPNPGLAPSWHVERDVTDLTSLLTSAQTGHIIIYNYMNSTDTSAITTGATLTFYPATKAYPAPVVPDQVIALASSAAGDTVSLSGPGNALSRTVSLPRNVERARIDVLSQGQIGDEFWYTCVPNAQAAALDTCGGGPFRESEVAVDGKPAGFAPVYPWIFTGGIDPYLWAPIAGVQTLNFVPQSIELTPFAGLLDNGAPHTISLSVNGANNYFSATATLYLYLDHGAAADTGAVLADTIGAAPTPTPTVKLGSTDPAGNLPAEVNTTVLRDGSVSGLLHTSHGAVTTVVRQNTSFVSRQSFLVGPALDEQTVKQTTNYAQIVDTIDGAGERQVASYERFPLTVAFDYAVAADGSASQVASVSQELLTNLLTTQNGAVVSQALLDEAVIPTDTLDISAAGYISGHTGMSSTGLYAAGGTTGCLTRRLAAANSVLTKLNQSTSCDDSALAKAAALSR